MGKAVNEGARTINHLTEIRSAHTPMKGFSNAGNCMTVDRRPARVNERENFSISSGNSGERKLE
jgi:hypothetical protein